jgi:Ser/Thr protein kinase RdoA (MazF antagonist)
MMEHDYRHLNPNFDMDAWLDVVDTLAPGNHSARDFPADRPLVHVTGPSGDLVLRRWPEGTPASRIEFAAKVLDAVRAEAGEMVPVIDPVPGDPDKRFITVKDRAYTRSPYLPGLPLGRYGGFHTPDGRAIDLPLPESAKAHGTVAEVARLIAKGHEATQEIAADGNVPARTLQSFMDDVRKGWFAQRKVLGDRAAEQRDIRRWLRCGNRLIPTSSDLLRNEPAIMRERLVVNHNHLWPVNILVEGRDNDRKVTGIIGWSQAAAGSPVLDIAALTVQMQGWSAALTEGIVDAYATTRRLQPEQRRLIPAVASLMLVDRVADLLTLAYLDERMIDHRAAPSIRSGMKTLLNSLETLTGILAPDIEQTSRFARRAGGRPPIGGGKRFPREGGSGGGQRGFGRRQGADRTDRSKQRGSGKRDQRKDQ